MITIPVRASYAVTDGIVCLTKAEYVDVPVEAVAAYIQAHAGDKIAEAINKRKGGQND